MHTARRSAVLIAIAAFCVLSGALLAGAGAWLILLGGSWYYLACGLTLVVVSVLLYRRSRLALWVYALLVLATLAWSLWEVGLDWWPLAARGDVVFVLGLFLLLPPVVRSLSGQVDVRKQSNISVASNGMPINANAPAARYGAASLALAGALGMFLAVAVASWFVDVNQTENHLLAEAAPPVAFSGDIPDGDWHAYGRTGYGQRYSPLNQITPENISQLELVWQYKTGGLPRKGDSTETLFEVTPLKIGNHLYFCIPHQLVIALDATTGKEVWRYDPKIEAKLAQQRLTCRALAYYVGDHRFGADDALVLKGLLPENTRAPATPLEMGPPEVSSPSEAGVVAAGSIEAAMAADERLAFSQPRDPAPSAPGQPVAADNGQVAEVCDAMLFMATADARVIALDPKSGAVCKAFGGGTGQINLWANMPSTSITLDSNSNPNLNPNPNPNPNSNTSLYPSSSASPSPIPSPSPVLQRGYSSLPIAVTDSLIIVGSMVRDDVPSTETSGVIRAFDVKTGGLVWNWETGNPDETRPIAPEQTYTAGSLNSGAVFSVDSRLGMVYVPMGNARPDQWGAKGDDNTAYFSSSVVALDLGTGRVRWVFQAVQYGLWNDGLTAQPSLVDLDIDGKTVPVLVQPTKQGELFVLNRATGKLLHPDTAQPAPQAAQKSDGVHARQPASALSMGPPELSGASMWGVTLFDQLACRIAFHSLRYDGRFTPPSTQGSLMYPGDFGASNWGNVAIDPQRQVVLATPTYLAHISRLVPRRDGTGNYVAEIGRTQNNLSGPNTDLNAHYVVQQSPFTSPLGIPCNQPPWGAVGAVDLTTGKIVWMHRNGMAGKASSLPFTLPLSLGVPNPSGPTMTASGVAFLSGTFDYYVRAYDARTGEALWKDRLAVGSRASPITYLGRDGRQYVVVVAGAGGNPGAKTADETVRAYALPQQ